MEPMGMSPGMGDASAPITTPASMTALHGWRAHKFEITIFAVIFMLVFAGVGYLGYLKWQAVRSVQSLQNINAALDEAGAATTTVPATSDPLKDATPVVDPTQKTNPFTPKDNEYQNPF